MLVLLWSRATAAQPTVFTDVKVRFNRSEKDRRLVDKVAVLVFDSAARRLVVNSPESPERSLNIPYDTIQNIHFEITTHMRGGVLAELISAAAAVSVGVPEAGVPLSSLPLDFSKREGAQSRWSDSCGHVSRSSPSSC